MVFEVPRLVTRAAGRRRPSAPFCFASAPAARMRRTPGASVASGFSMKTCLPASTAASKCPGRKPGGWPMTTTSTPLSISLLVGVQADELAFLRHIDLIAEAAMLGRVVAALLAASKLIETALQTIGKSVGHRPELDRAGGADGLGRRAGAAGPAADEADFDFVADPLRGYPGRMRGPRDEVGQNKCGSGAKRRSGKELPATGGRGSRRDVVWSVHDAVKLSKGGSGVQAFDGENRLRGDR